jgi:hypothetical protein
MAWQPGQSGNPNGSAKEKVFLAALARAIASDDGKRLRAGAEKVLDLHAEGVPWAVAFLADRLDGKAHQSVDVIADLTTRKAASDYTDDELAAIVNARRGD